MRKMIFNHNNYVTARTFSFFKYVTPNSSNIIRTFMFLISILLIAAILFSGCGSDQVDGNQSNDRGNSEKSDSKITMA